MTNVAITSTVKNYPKRIAYNDIKDSVMGKNYALSLVFIGSQRAQSINKNYRKKTYAPNVLSFPLTEVSGEIFICPEVAKKEAYKFNLSQNGYIAYLFIHGLIHLKGHDHGDTMDKLERKYLKAFKIK